MQRYQAEVRGELAAARAVAAEARAEAVSRAADAQASAARATEAESELGRARAEALTYKQEVQRYQVGAGSRVWVRQFECKLPRGGPNTLAMSQR